MGGFIDPERNKVSRAASDGNNGGTVLGAVDAACHAPSATQVTRSVMRTGFGAEAALGARSLPMSGMLSYAGGALSALGLADNVYDMAENGANANNVTNAASNVLNVASSGAAIFGAEGGAAATTLGPLAAAGALGLTIGSVGNASAKRRGWAGQNDEGENRSWSELAADWGSYTRAGVTGVTGNETMGFLGGLGGTLGGSIVGAGGALDSSVYEVGSEAYDLLGSIF